MRRLPEGGLLQTQTRGELAALGDREGLLRAMRRHRSELARALEDLSLIARKRVALGSALSRRPWRWIAGALLVGLWLGSSRRR